MQRSQWRIPGSTGEGVETFVKTGLEWFKKTDNINGYYENGYYMINDG